MEYISSSSSSENDDFEDTSSPIEEKKYNYNINHLLNEDIDNILESNKYNKIYLCCYEVNNKKSLVAPFLHYYLIMEKICKTLHGYYYLF